MKERILCLLKDKKYETAARLLSALINDEDFFELRNILNEINEAELDHLLLLLDMRHRQALLKLVLKPEGDIPITEETAALTDSISLKSA